MGVETITKKIAYAFTIMFLLVISILSPATALNETSQTQTGTYQYDTAGNLVKDDRYYYEYNIFNQLIKVKQTSSTGKTLLEVYYSPEGQRIKKVYHADSGDVTTYYISSNYIETQSINGTDSEVYYYLNGKIVARKDKTGKYFYLPDYLGGPDVIVDETGKVVNDIEYYPFGYLADGGKERFQFTGKELDPETDLMYFESRYYSPFTGRFTQPDTMIPDAYDSQSLNRYSYARNNPLKYTDPTGHWIETVVDIASLGYDLNELWNNPKDWVNWAAVGLDLVTTALPVVAGGGLLLKGAVRGGEALNKANDIKNVAKGAEAAKTASKTDKIKDAVEYADVTDLHVSQLKVDTDKVSALTTSMKRSGFSETAPIRYITDDTGKKIITDGHHRWVAAQKAGLTKVPVAPAPKGLYGYYTDLGRLRTYEETIRDSLISEKYFWSKVK